MMEPKMHPTAIVSPDAFLGDGVEIGPYTIVHENVRIGDGARIAAYCELGVDSVLGDGSPLVVGAGALIRYHAIFYVSSRFGSGLVTGHRVTVRENTVAGESFQIGSGTEIQGDCCIGDFVRFQSNVFVGKKTVLGNYVWVLPNVIFTNDPTPPSNQLIGATVDDYASISAGALIMPGVRVGRHALVAAAACVTKDVHPGVVVAGVPARVVGLASEILLRDGSGEPAYPWTRHFHRGYPKDVVETWQQVTIDKETPQNSEKPE